jgi:hypothetical protein
MNTFNYDNVSIDRKSKSEQPKYEGEHSVVSKEEYDSNQNGNSLILC